jgi:hypothetical protein
VVRAPLEGAEERRRHALPRAARLVRALQPLAERARLVQVHVGVLQAVVARVHRLGRAEPELGLLRGGGVRRARDGGERWERRGRLRGRCFAAAASFPATRE